MIGFDVLGQIPIFGNGIVAGFNSFGGGSVLDSATKDVAGIFNNIGKGDFEDAALNTYAAWSIFFGGTPVTAIRRAIRVAKSGNPMDLIGIRQKQQRRRQWAMP